MLTGGVYGTGIGLGLTDGTSLFGFKVAGGTPYNNIMFQSSEPYGAAIGTFAPDFAVKTADRLVGVTADYSKSGLAVTTSGILRHCIKY